jgi:hypothetical protein
MALHGHSRMWVADSNPNLTVQLFRQPAGEWVGIRAQAGWRPAGGLAGGSGGLLDVHGEIGRVSMSVIPVPFPPGPKAEPPAGAGGGVKLAAKRPTSVSIGFMEVNWI